MFCKLIKPHRLASLLLVSIFVALSLPSHAEQVTATAIETSTGATKSLTPVTVTATRLDQLSSTVTIDRELIDKLPSGNAGLNDLLEIVPGVQLSEDYRNSTQAGEIKPPEVSISGGRPGDNRYILDGVGFNSYLNPNVTNKSLATDLPGHSQEFFIPAHLIEDITVYRSNIPARYGGFGGGVQLVKTKDPEPEFGGDLTYRTTRDEWTSFHIDPEIKDDFYNSVDEDYQPDFSKHFFDGIINVPINDISGLRFLYSRHESSIPLSLLTKKETQERRNETFDLKYVLEPDFKSKITLSALYNPYQEDLFLRHTSESNFKLTSDGYKLAGKLEREAKIGRIELNLAWQKSGFDREAPQNWYNWNTTDVKNAGEVLDRSRSPEGGYGDIKKTQKTWVTNTHIDFAPIATGAIEHSFNSGFEIEHIETIFKRQETTTRYSAAKNDPNVDCNGNTEDCIDGDQFFWFKNVYPEYRTEADINNYSVYLEDEIEIYRLTLRPGLRISYNDYQENTDYAPRFATSYDLFGDGKTLLLGGYNRYYKTGNVADKLNEQNLNRETWRRSTVLAADKQPKDWTQSPPTVITTRIADLNTPYTDEFTAGIRQEIFGGTLEFLYIDRKYRDEIVTINIDDDDNDITYREFSNEGRRDYEEYSINWEKSWANHYLMIDGTWSETKSNSLHYDDLFDPNELEEFVWHYGKAVRIHNLRQSNYNRPFIGKLIYAVSLPYGVSFTNETIYRNRYRSVKKTGDTYTDPETGLELDIYENYTGSSSVIFDWKFAWETPEYKSNQLVLSLDLLNVFNRKITIGETIDEYHLGRQLWAGITYKF